MRETFPLAFCVVLAQVVGQFDSISEESQSQYCSIGVWRARRDRTSQMGRKKTLYRNETLFGACEAKRKTRSFREREKRAGAA